MSPLGLAVQQPDPYRAGCTAPAADCPSNTSRAALGQEDHACCPFDPASSSCCSTQQHFVPLSPHHTLSYGTKHQIQRRSGKKNVGVMGVGAKTKKKFLPTTSTSSDNGSGGFFLAPTELLGIYFLTLHPPFSFKRYDSYCSNQPGWMEGTEAKPAPGVNTPVWKRPYCSNPALLTCPSTTSFLK